MPSLVSEFLACPWPEEGSFLAKSAEAIEKFIGAMQEQNGADWRAVRRHLHDSQMYKWIVEQNTCVGVAPSTGALLSYKSTADDDQGNLSWSLEPWSTRASSSTERMWAIRWRKRMRVCLENCRLREALTPQQLQEKARVLASDNSSRSLTLHSHMNRLPV